MILLAAERARLGVVAAVIYNGRDEFREVEETSLVCHIKKKNQQSSVRVINTLLTGEEAQEVDCAQRTQVVGPLQFEQHFSKARLTLARCSRVWAPRDFGVIQITKTIEATKQTARNCEPRAERNGTPELSQAMPPER
jgi:hypothetical protein